MYNFPGSPYGQPPGFGGFPPGQGPPLGMGGKYQIFLSFSISNAKVVPPGMAAPGTDTTPGTMPQQQPIQQQQMRGGFPPNFQNAINMPNINFSAPVIRLGMTGPGKGGMGEPNARGDTARGRAGLGSQLEHSRQQTSNNMAVLIPPTKDEIIRTIFVGGITEGVGGDEGMERILSSVGNLKKWIRATDADGKSCRFGFAEYEDADSLATAVEVLKGVQIPVHLQSMDKDDDAEKKEVEKSLLTVSCLSLLHGFKLTYDRFLPMRAPWII